MSLSGVSGVSGLSAVGRMYLQLSRTLRRRPRILGLVGSSEAREQGHKLPKEAYEVR